ncbi:hypothetical protein BD309DRAFT_656944 [Dichomitus squalens]|nr:hypothetical protein BD309DRAFT_656944 [Dichomitus squalens]
MLPRCCALTIVWIGACAADIVTGRFDCLAHHVHPFTLAPCLSRLPYDNGSSLNEPYFDRPAVLEHPICSVLQACGMFECGEQHLRDECYGCLTDIRKRYCKPTQTITVQEPASSSRCVATSSPSCSMQPGRTTLRTGM